MPYSMSPRTFVEMEVLDDFDGELVDSLYVKGEWGTQLTTIWKPINKHDGKNLQPAWYSMGSKKEFTLSVPGTITVGEKTFEGGYIAEGPDLNKASKLAKFFQALEAVGFTVPESPDCRLLLGLRASLKRVPYEARGLDVEKKILLPVKILAGATPAAKEQEVKTSAEDELVVLEAQLMQSIGTGIKLSDFLKQAYPVVKGNKALSVQVMKGTWIEAKVKAGEIKREGDKLSLT